MNKRLKIEDFRGGPQHIVAAIDSHDSSEWSPFNWRVRPKKSILLPSELIYRLSNIGEVYDAELISRFIPKPCRMSRTLMLNLIDECEEIYGISDDEAILYAVQKIADIAGYISYEQSLWLLVDSPPVQVKGKSVQPICNPFKWSATYQHRQTWVPRRPALFFLY